MEFIKKIVFSALLMSSSFAVVAQNLPVYKNKNATTEARVADLLKRMTLEEKLQQISQFNLGRNDNPNNINERIQAFDGRIGSVIYSDKNPERRNNYQKKAMETRLGIPVLFGKDVIHGLITIYPISLATGCSWNPDLYQQASAIAAREAYLSGVNWTFSPMVDIGRDPRWGRVAEGYGEDPYSTSVFAVAAIKGYQGDKLSAAPNKLLANLKHFVAYGLSEGGRDYTYTEVSKQALWETYFPPYKAGVDAGAMTVMSSFNDISGVPATANHYTLTDVLKKQWGFKGFVVADWQAVEQLVTQGVAKNRLEAGQKALTAGLDMDMLSNIYITKGKELLDKKLITQQQVDEAVSRILNVKFIMGLFENPYTPVVDESERYLQDDAKKIATKLAEESIVLLKNKDNILPVIASDIKSIAFIGPVVRDSAALIGAWSKDSDKKYVTSILEAAKQKLSPSVTVNYARGCRYDGTDESGFAEAIDMANKSDVVVMCMGEMQYWSGENASRSRIELPEIQEKLISEIKKTGKKIVLVLENGRPLGLAKIEPQVDAIVEAWQPGTYGAEAILNVLLGQVNPSGKLSITFPRTTGQIPLYYNMRQSSRPIYGHYQDLAALYKDSLANEPLYYFGHGLSYTTFKYDSVKLSSTKITKTQKITATVNVTNTGNLDGSEVVHWFICDPYATISRPMKELKYFDKKLIKKGATATYQFTIDPDRDLTYPDDSGKKILEAGEFYLVVGDQKIKFELL